MPILQRGKNHTRGEDIFALVDENILLLNLQWKNCISICTDGCPSMQGKNRGFVAHVRHQNLNVFVVYCMVHREALVFKTLPTNLHSVMKQVIEVVNFIKARPLQSRLFYATLPRNGFKIQMLAVSLRSPLAFKRKGAETCMPTKG